MASKESGRSAAEGEKMKAKRLVGMAAAILLLAPTVDAQRAGGGRSSGGGNGSSGGRDSGRSVQVSRGGDRASKPSRTDRPSARSESRGSSSKRESASVGRAPQVERSRPTPARVERPQSAPSQNIARSGDRRGPSPTASASSRGANERASRPNRQETKKPRSRDTTPSQPTQRRPEPGDMSRPSQERPQGSVVGRDPKPNQRPAVIDRPTDSTQGRLARGTTIPENSSLKDAQASISTMRDRTRQGEARTDRKPDRDNRPNGRNDGRGGQDSQSALRDQDQRGWQDNFNRDRNRPDGNRGDQARRDGDDRRGARGDFDRDRRGRGDRGDKDCDRDRDDCDRKRNRYRSSSWCGPSWWYGNGCGWGGSGLSVSIGTSWSWGGLYYNYNSCAPYYYGSCYRPNYHYRPYWNSWCYSPSAYYLYGPGYDWGITDVGYSTTSPNYNYSWSNPSTRYGWVENNYSGTSTYEVQADDSVDTFHQWQDALTDEPARGGDGEKSLDVPAGQPGVAEGARKPGPNDARVEPAGALGAGWEMLSDGRDQEALEFFAGAVEKDASRASAQAGYGVAALLMGRHDAAEFALRRAISTNALSLGFLPVDERLAARLAETSRGLRSGADSANRWLLVGIVDYIRHDRAGAVEALTRATDLGETDAAARTLLSVVK